MVTVTLENVEGEFSRDADRALVVFGRVPNTEDLGLQDAGVECDERGYVVVGDYQQTSVPGIFAIGDITRTPALAHVATAEGEAAVEFMAGHTPAQPQLDTARIPSAIYCEPQVAGFGLREDELGDRKIRKSVFHYPGAGKSIAVGKPDGLVKILCDDDTGEILGAHIVGHNATELIHELLLAASAELLPEDLTSTVHAHPTLSEAILEAARGIDGQPIHA
jgi:dihydrolipoamide dehydrogenase